MVVVETVAMSEKKVVPQFMSQPVCSLARFVLRGFNQKYQWASRAVCYISAGQALWKPAKIVATRAGTGLAATQQSAATPSSAARRIVGDRLHQGCIRS